MHHALLRALGQLGVGVRGHGAAKGDQREQGEERLRGAAGGGSAQEGSGDEAHAVGGFGGRGVELEVTAVDVNVMVGGGRWMGGCLGSGLLMGWGLAGASGPCLRDGADAVCEEAVRAHSYSYAFQLECPRLVALCRQANKLYAAEFGVQPRAMDLSRVSSSTEAAAEAARAHSGGIWGTAEP